MPPDLGRGACEALIDAVALAAHLRDAETVSDGLRMYDEKRRQPVQRLAAMSSAAARLTRVRPRWLRDTVLRTVLLGGPPA